MVTAAAAAGRSGRQTRIGGDTYVHSDARFGVQKNLRGNMILEEMKRFLVGKVHYSRYNLSYTKCDPINPPMSKLHHLYINDTIKIK